MKTVSCVLVAVSLLLTGLALPADAAVVPPAYEGDLGNPEMVATRPYKWMYRGVKAAVYQTFTSIRDGNIQSPVIGTANGVRGVRQGAVELTESAFRGMIFSAAPRPGHHKSVLSANQYINNDWMLRNGTDLITSIVLVEVMAGSIQDSDQVIAVAGLWTLFKLNQHFPYNAQWEQDMNDMNDWFVRRNRRLAIEAAEGDPVKRAQRRYIGARADTNPQAPGQGNLLRARK